MGHTGTLDPLVTGVLPVCLGKTTKLIQYLPSDKQYIAEITLGITTDTYDGEGNILTSNKANVIEEDIQTVLNSFKGEITQQVPLTSATHYKGKKLYEYAHKGIVIEDLPTKQVTIYKLSLIKIKDSSTNNPILEVCIDCSSGTYVRSLASDIGKKLGCGAYMSKLVRSMASGLHLENSITIEELEQNANNNTIEKILIHPYNLINWPKLEVKQNIIDKLSQGQYFKTDQSSLNDQQLIFLVNNTDNIVAIGKYQQELSIIKPRIVFV